MAPRKTYLLLAAVFSPAIFFLLYLNLHLNSPHRFKKRFDKSEEIDLSISAARTKELRDLVESQSKTIENLLGLIEKNSKRDVSSNNEEENVKLHDEIAQLRQLIELEKRKQYDSSQLILSNKENSIHNEARDIPRTQHDKECYDRFSWGLIDIWKNKKEIWCEADDKSEIQSDLICYPYHQKGKPRISLFCEASNFFIDFTKVSGGFGPQKPSGNQYLNFANGATFSTCKKTGKFDENKLMNHMREQLSGGAFHDNISPPHGSYQTIETPTYLLARDEDCENNFHAMADHINIFNVLQILDIDFNNLQVVLWDRHPDTSFKELYQAAFSPNHNIKRQGDYKGVVMFQKLIFHLESPAGPIHVGIMDPWTCHNSELFATFRAHVLKAFNLWEVPPPVKPQVVLSVRRRTQHKNVGRVCSNEQELENVLREGNMMDFQVLDLATLSFGKQLEIMRKTNVLVGIHGAGHMHAYFLAEEAVLVELHPPYRLDRHFRNAARMNNKIYFPYRVMSDRVDCQGTSDSITVNVGEFRKVMDGALRLARSFHDGLSECGLHCDPQILALNRRLDKLYRPGDGQIVNPQKPRFPC